VLIIIVLVDAGRVSYNAIRKPESVKLAEAPFEQSKIVAPAGMFATSEEKAELALVGAGAPASAGDGDGDGDGDAPAKQGGGQA
jgi:carbon starvation protein